MVSPLLPRRPRPLTCRWLTIHPASILAVLLIVVGYVHMLSNDTAEQQVYLIATHMPERTGPKRANRIPQRDAYESPHGNDVAALKGLTASSDSSPAPRVAHVVSFINCKEAARAQGYLDTLMILRHSIHQNSIHSSNANIKSKYSYQMVAIIYERGGCVQYLPAIERFGYIPLIRPIPVNVSEITTNDWYRDNVRRENCCGDAEFVKLYAYQLTQYPIVVHWDLDVLVLQPMDDIFDAIMYDKSSTLGQAARQRLQLQYPRTPLPDRIDAFFTRDVTSANPWEQIRAIQGGFVVIRPNAEHLLRYQRFIMEANYTRGRGPMSGWGGMGYGGFQGAMAYQGVLAYFYDQIYPGFSVELDVCRWNQVVADVIYRGPEYPERVGQCRQYPVDGNHETNTFALGKCDDCRVLPVAETRTVHFTACKKPWECRLPNPYALKNKAKEVKLRELTNVTTCGLLFRKYFDIRHEMESWIYKSIGDTHPVSTGDFYPEFFRGYCKGKRNYVSIEQTSKESFSASQIYGF